MRYTLLLLVATTCYSCSDKSFINHELVYSKKGDCTDTEKPVKMLSNVAGERYQFEACLDAGFDGKNYTVSRQGDSILVDFPLTKGPKAAFEITLDIDANPAYHHIFLDGKEIKVGSEQLLDVQ